MFSDTLGRNAKTFCDNTKYFFQIVLRPQSYELLILEGNLEIIYFTIVVLQKRIIVPFLPYCN
jgi:hypothetical protein